MMDTRLTTQGTKTNKYTFILRQKSLRAKGNIKLSFSSDDLGAVDLNEDFDIEICENVKDIKYNYETDNITITKENGQQIETLHKEKYFPINFYANPFISIVLFIINLFLQ